MSFTGESKTLKRIHNDLKENAKNPIDGIQIFPENEDYFNLHCEIKILHGPYKDITIHSVLHIPPSYPIIGPAMNICNDFILPYNFHHHIIGTSICNDMLTNYKSYFETIDGGMTLKKASGWSSGYTLNVILSQMQIFFSDPDMDIQLSPQEIKNLVDYSKNYPCKSCKNKSLYRLDEEKIENSETNLLKKRLVCGLTKSTLLTETDISFGYPVLINKDRFGRLWPQILIEIMSYKGYKMQLDELGYGKVENFDQIKMFSPSGEQYNYWIPLYINEDHYARNLELILNSLSVIRNGKNITMQNKFNPETILDVLPCLINKTIVLILNGTIFHSLAAIQTYCHLLRLYYRLIDQYPKLKSDIEYKVKQFKSFGMRNKKFFPDLGEFIINLFFSGFKYEDVKLDLFREFMARQIFWIEKNESKTLEAIEPNKLIETVFKSSSIANQLLMFNLQAAKCFISADRMKQIDERLGFISEDLMSQFKSDILRIKSISSYKDFFSEIRINEFDSDEKIKNMLFESKAIAFKSNYISKK